MDESSTKVNLVEADLKNKQPGRTFTGPTCINFIFLTTTMFAMSIDIHLTASITLAIDGG